MKTFGCWTLIGWGPIRYKSVSILIHLPCLTQRQTRTGQSLLFSILWKCVLNFHVQSGKTERRRVELEEGGGVLEYLCMLYVWVDEQRKAMDMQGKEGKW